MYRAKVEYVQDDALVARFGVREVSLTAIGCCSQGMAQRAGRWAILTNQYETEMVTFSTGLEGIRALPGQVIKVADSHRAGKRIGGRISAATPTILTLDQIVGSDNANMAGSTVLLAGGSWLVGSGQGGDSIAPGDQITAILPDGTAEVRTVAEITGKYTVRVTTAFSDTPVAGSIWAQETEELKTQLFRIVSISETGPLEYGITATKYIQGKHENIDYGTIISSRPVTSIPANSIQPPENIQISTDWKVDQYAAVTKLIITWDAVDQAVRYDVEWKRNDGDWVDAGRVATTEVEVEGVYAGEYVVRVRSMTVMNVLSPWGLAGPTYLAGKTSLPPSPVGVTTISEIFAIRLKWGVPVGAEDTAYSQIQMGNVIDDSNPTDLGRFAYPTNVYLHTGMAAAVVKWFRVRLIDKTGNIGPWSPWTYGISSADADAVLDYLTGKITDTQLGQELLEKIDTGGESGAAIEVLSQTVNDLEQGLSASYSIKLGINQDGQYYAAGMGIGIENTPEGMQSQVLFLADRFAVLNQINGVAVSPFIIQGGQTIINNAVIGEATISWLKINDDVQSTNYVPGQTGWRLSKAGGIEFNGVVAGGGRMTINNQTVMVYDANGTLRVRLGIWS
jgi:predicted phage tail protein